MLKGLGAPQLIGSAAVVIGLGLVSLYSASAVRAELVFGVSTTYLLRQFEGLAIGLAAGTLAALLPLGMLRKLAFVAWGGTTLLLAATLTPLGVQHHGAQRWLGIGGPTFQPLEFAKLGLVLGLARWLSSHDKQLHRARISLGVPALLVSIPAGLLLLQPDFGGAAILVAFTVVLVFVAGARLSHLAAATAVALPSLALIAISEPYRWSRLRSFVDPFADATGQGYQLVQSLLAFGIGGTFGTGIGAGQQKLGFLPEAHTDFILAVVGEEMGLVGVAGVLGLFGLMGVASLGIASRARDSFSMLLATGAGLLLWLQGCLNAGVAMGLLPTKGATLPLFSYGRSSLVVSLIAIGLLLNVARPRASRRSGWR
ncbi:MAG: cell division protein FtsW [Myxococcales bacterium]|nr:cell division protein FtsW [Myxococcales bacterium]